MASEARRFMTAILYGQNIASVCRASVEPESDRSHCADARAGCAGGHAPGLAPPPLSALGGASAGAAAARRAGADDRHVRRPGLRRPGAVHAQWRAAGADAAPAVDLVVLLDPRANVRGPQWPRSRAG